MTAAFRGARRRLRRDERVDRERWYLERWTEAADDRGWEIGWTDAGYTELRRAGTTLRVRGADVSIDTHLTYRIAGNKGLTNRLLCNAGLPITDSVEFGALDLRDVFAHVGDEPHDHVFKPAAGTGGGAGVTVGPVGRRMVLGALRDAGAFARRVRIDRRVEGRVVRVLVLGGRVLDSVERSAATVVGDGRSTVAELVQAENDRRRALGAAATGLIALSTDHRAALHRAHLSRSTVVAAGRRVAVAGRSNTGSELESHRIEIGPAATDVAERAAGALGVELAGVDLMIDARGEVAVVLEVNTGPGLHWHVLTDDAPFDPFTAILDEVAPN